MSCSLVLMEGREEEEEEEEAQLIRVTEAVEIRADASRKPQAHPSA